MAQKYNIDINKIRKPGGTNASGIYIGTGSGTRESLYAVRGTGGGSVVIYDKVLYELEMNNITNVGPQGGTFTLANYVTKNKRTHGNGSEDNNIQLDKTTLTIEPNTDTASTKSGSITVTQYDDALGAYVGASTTVSWNQQADYPASLSLVLANPAVIPAGGGSVNSVGATATCVYASGAQRVLDPSEYTIAWTGVTATSLGTAITSSETTVGTLKANATYTCNGVTKTASAEKEVKQEANTVQSTTYGNPVLTNVTLTCAKIPCTGGTVTPTTAGTVTQSRTRTLKSGSELSDTITVTPSVTYSPSSVTGENLHKTTKDETKLTAVTATFTANGKSATKSVDVYQEQNHYTDSWNNPVVSMSPTAATVGSAATSQAFTASATQSGTRTWDTTESTAITNSTFTYAWSSNNTAFTANSTTTACTVSFAANPNEADRSATITASVTGQSKTGKTTATLTQKAKSSPQPTPSTTATLSPTAFTQNGGNATLTITSNTGWTASTNVNWITIPTTAGTTSLTQNNVTISANTGSARTGKITVTNGTQTIEINVSQDAYSPAASTTASLSPLTVDSEGLNEGSAATLSITSNVAWTASSNVDWIIIHTGTGSGNLTQDVEVIPNNSSSQRQGIVTVTNGINYTTAFTLTQGSIRNPYVYTIRLGYFATEPEGDWTRKITYTFTSAGTSVQTLKIYSEPEFEGMWPYTTEWHFENVPSWIYISRMSGVGDATVYISAATNTTTTSRGGQNLFTLSKRSGGQYDSRTFNVTQDAGSGPTPTATWKIYNSSNQTITGDLLISPDGMIDNISVRPLETQDRYETVPFSITKVFLNAGVNTDRSIVVSNSTHGQNIIATFDTSLNTWYGEGSVDVGSGTGTIINFSIA